MPRYIANQCADDTCTICHPELASATDVAQVEPTALTADAAAVAVDAALGAEVAISEPDATDNDDSVTCFFCGDSCPNDDETGVMARGGEIQSAHRHCAEGHGSYLYVGDNHLRDECEFVHQRHVVIACDSEEHATLEYARRNWYFSDGGDWYADGDNAPSDEDTDDYSENGASMYEYHGTNVLRVHGWPRVTPKDSLCFGVELEMESTDGHSVRSMCEALGNRDGNGRYILMSDGSLTYGTELITRPYLLEYHQTTFRWAAVLAAVDGMAKSGAGTENCGMHVHVNRKAISPLTLGKMLVFINSTANIPYVKVIAQRNPASWAAFKTKKITDGINYSAARYEALNVSEHTVEFRIFRGNLRPERVLKNIEFCHAVVSFARDTSIAGLTWDSFAKFITNVSRRKSYPNLIKFIQEKMAAALPAAIRDQFNTTGEL